jgi:hypothetical protein
MNRIFKLIPVCAALCFASCTNKVEEEKEAMKALTQIDQAKEEFALQKRLTPGALIAESDLAPYLKNDFFKHPVGGRYIINVYGKPPESTKYGALSK